MLDEIAAFGRMAGYNVQVSDLSEALYNDQHDLLERSDWAPTPDGERG